ncbi:MAG: hypothetical protein ACI8TP_002875 [Acidimicrobiales bacterium]
MPNLRRAVRQSLGVISASGTTLIETLAARSPEEHKQRAMRSVERRRFRSDADYFQHVIDRATRRANSAEKQIHTGMRAANKKSTL